MEHWRRKERKWGGSLKRTVLKKLKKIHFFFKFSQNTVVLGEKHASAFLTKSRDAGRQNLVLCATDYMSQPKMRPFWTHLFTWKSLTTLTLQRLKIPIDLHFYFVSLTTLVLIIVIFYTLMFPGSVALKYLLLNSQTCTSDKWGLKD